MARSYRRSAVVLGPVLLASLTLPAVANAAVTSNPGVPQTRFSGVNRYDTAAKIATATFPSADTVVIASGASFADALAGNYLAGNVGGPILLTDPNSLSPETAAALAALKARTVLLLGGTGAVSAGVATAIGAMTSTNAAGGKVVVTRISGASRYDTDKAVVETPPASYVGGVGGEKTALLASGVKFPDALAGGALAFGGALPILLTDPASLSPQAAAAIHDLGIQQVVILGGPAAVSAAVESALAALGVTTTRLAGATRTATAAAIATYAGTTLGWATGMGQAANKCPADALFANVNVARGDDGGGGVDALALGPHAGTAKAPIMLTTSVDDPSVDLFCLVGESSGDSSAPGPLAGIDIAGGTGAVSAGNAALLDVASGGGQTGDMTVTPTAATAGTQLTATSTDPCPAAPTGALGVLTFFLVPVAGGGQFQVVQSPMSLAGGPFTLKGAIPAGTAAGQYDSIVVCGTVFAGEDVFYAYAADIGPVIAVS
ncbi:MAG TPA: cell wall-binding repeat-containing protein [Kineosporiaceae bacterium]|nr:cell wall-binding repeat-containing protein [Kineosporiaceae bacterium]